MKQSQDLQGPTGAALDGGQPLAAVQRRGDATAAQLASRSGWTNSMEVEREKGGAILSVENSVFFRKQWVPPALLPSSPLRFPTAPSPLMTLLPPFSPLPGSSVSSPCTPQCAEAWRDGHYLFMAVHCLCAWA